jgi:hypothetical protein
VSDEDKPAAPPASETKTVGDRPRVQLDFDERFGVIRPSTYDWGDALVTLDASLANSEAEDLTRQRTKAELRSLEQDTDMRAAFAGRIFLLLAMWMISVIIIVTETGRGFLGLSDTVLIMLLGTSTANVIGLFAIVARYLFPRKQ